MMALLIQLCEADHGGGVSLLRPHLPQFCDYMLALAFAGQGNTEAAQAAALVAQAATQASIAASTLAGANAAAPPATECAAAEAAAATGQSAAEALEGLESCRKLAVEVLLCCVEQKGQLMLHVSNFLKRLLQALLACMLDVRDSSYTKWLEEGEEDDDVSHNNREVIFMEKCMWRYPSLSLSLCLASLLHTMAGCSSLRPARVGA